jgi:hypothetical protein
VLTLAAIILTLAVQEAPHAPSSAGSLAGCASDTMTQRLPGVTVVAKRGRVHLITTADAGGCYELKNVPSGAYRVTARLTGFDNVTRDDVSIVTGSVARLDFAMRVSAICECVRVGGTTLAEQWDHADAVLHVRLAASESQPATPVGYYRHVATVIDALKKPAAPLETPLFVLQTQRSAAPGPYEIGQELVMFLRSSDSGGFMIANDEPGLAVPSGSSDPAIVFLIQDGHVQRAPAESSRYVGMPLGAFLDELRALSRGN